MGHAVLFSVDELVAEVEDQPRSSGPAVYELLQRSPRIWARARPVVCRLHEMPA